MLNGMDQHVERVNIYLGFGVVAKSPIYDSKIFSMVK